MAVAAEQEISAKAQEARVKVIEAEAEVQKARLMLVEAAILDCKKG